MEKIKHPYMDNPYNRKQRMVKRNPKNDIIGGTVCLIIGIILFFWGQSRMDYALSCANSPYAYYDPSSINAVYSAGSFLRFFGIFFLIVGIVGIVYGAVLQQQQINIKTVKSGPKRFCPKCGREIPFNSVVCPYCKYDFQ